MLDIHTYELSKVSKFNFFFVLLIQPVQNTYHTTDKFSRLLLFPTHRVAYLHASLNKTKLNKFYKILFDYKITIKSLYRND